MICDVGRAEGLLQRAPIKNHYHNASFRNNHQACSSRAVFGHCPAAPARRLPPGNGPPKHCISALFLKEQGWAEDKRHEVRTSCCRERIAPWPLSSADNLQNHGTAALHMARRAVVQLETGTAPGKGQSRTSGQAPIRWYLVMLTHKSAALERLPAFLNSFCAYVVQTAFLERSRAGIVQCTKGSSRYRSGLPLWHQRNGGRWNSPSPLRARAYCRTSKSHIYPQYPVLSPNPADILDSRYLSELSWSS